MHQKPCEETRLRQQKLATHSPPLPPPRRLPPRSLTGASCALNLPGTLCALLLPLMAGCTRQMWAQLRPQLQLLLLLLLPAALAQVSKPHVTDEEHAKQAGANRFLDSDIVSMERHVFRTDASAFEPNPVCPYRLHYMWTAEVDASLYSPRA